MKKSTFGIGVATLTLCALALTTGTALAYKGDPAVKGPNYTTERHSAMEAAFEKNDYTAWKALMPANARVTQVVTAENFAKFAQAHKLAEAGKLTEGKTIRTELGLGLHDNTGKGARGKGMGQGMHRGMNR